MIETLVATSSDPTMFTVLATGISALSGCVAYLWKQQTNHFATVEEKLNDCEEDREDLWKALIAQNPAAVTVRKQK
jgi:hypothetical protein